MKQDFNSPVDSLLRDYARRHAARASSVRADAVPERSMIDRNNMDHLDADEMAAFAENALPAAARARAIAHFADCNECRQLVVALTHAENIAPESARSIPPQSIRLRPSWREKFATFFALPATLRYAVPALAAVLFVALIVGIMFNRQREATLVASKQETQTASSLSDSASSDAENAVNSNANATAGSASRMSGSAPVSNTATTSATTTTTTNTTANTATMTRRAVNTNSYTSIKEAPATSASQNNSSGNASDNLPLVASITPSPATQERQYFDDDTARAPKRDRPAAAPSAANVNANMSGNSAAGVAAKQSEEVIVISNQAAKASRAEASSNAAQTSDSSSSFSTEARAASRRRAPSSRQAAKNALPVNGRTVNGADASAALLPSRRVNGRDFRRQGTRWIDAAYTRSQATTNIARGSKQYRALISAEPGIGKIVAQLDGEVIVVWKGRAYRIQ